VVDETVIEIFTAKMGITSSGLDLENTLFDGEERHIEGSSSKIEDQDISLANNLFVESVSDGSSGGLVDDTKDVHARDGSGILGCLTLRVIKVRRDGDDGVVDGGAKIRLSGLLHLEKDHGRNFFGRLKRGTD
jgi:hypothetical protein